jgi:hypothetical protein
MEQDFLNLIELLTVLNEERSRWRCNQAWTCLVLLQKRDMENIVDTAQARWKLDAVCPFTRGTKS